MLIEPDSLPSKKLSGNNSQTFTWKKSISNSSHLLKSPLQTLKWKAEIALTMEMYNYVYLRIIYNLSSCWLTSLLPTFIFNIYFLSLFPTPTYTLPFVIHIASSNSFFTTQNNTMLLIMEHKYQMIPITNILTACASASLNTATVFIPIFLHVCITWKSN